MSERDERSDVANEELWALAKKVADAPEFRKAPRLREFLLFACECGLHDRQHELREQGIGCAIFGRRPGYNCSEDNIVRVEARKLRMRLERYFVSEGRDEPVLIEIPTLGLYVLLAVESRTRAAGATYCFSALRNGHALVNTVRRSIPNHNRLWRC